MTFFTLSSLPLSLSAQNTAEHKPKHHQYKLYDIGTLGGPNTTTVAVIPGVSNNGTVIGGSNTSTPGVTHAFQWRRGVLTDLGALPGANNFSYSFMSNGRGDIDGESENGLIDPATGYPEVHSVRWRNGQILDLGTFGGTQSTPSAINNRGQIVGWALNDIPDPLSTGFWGVGLQDGFPGTTQTRAFVWQDGKLTDLGTLGGPDAKAYGINQRGQIVGNSYIDSNINSTTGIPTVHPFLWDKGQMIDLGSLGGTISWAWWVNESGQVLGRSTLAGDQADQGFVWERGVMTELSLGGSYGNVLWNNNAGDVVGWSSLSDFSLPFDAFLWSHGQLRDIGTLPGTDCAFPWAINASKQVVGQAGLSCSNTLAFLWEDSGPMVDLNTLVEPASDVTLFIAVYINDPGQILAEGTLPNGDTHTFLLVPDGNCDDACEARIAAKQNAAAIPRSAATSNLPLVRGLGPNGRLNPLPNGLGHGLIDLPPAERR
jgi:probable HAF family extracellular repeat protein